MPELPEIETIRLFLKDKLIGKTIKNINVLQSSMFHGNPKVAIGSKVEDVSRKGKILHIKLKHPQLTTHNPQMYLSFHLKLSGQILYAPDAKNAVFEQVIPRADSDRMPAKTTRVVLYFDDGSALYFNDMRKFGWVKLTATPEVPAGRDVLDDAFTIDYLRDCLAGIKKPIKVLLLDQDKIAGIGNIYANDSLWQAKIHPTRKANTIYEDELFALYDGIKTIIDEGVKLKGSSAQDELYIIPDGTKGVYQHHFKVYHMHGTQCRRCKTLIVRIELGGRGTFFCPKCQH